MARFSLGCPDKDKEMEIFDSQKVKHLIGNLKPVGSAEKFIQEKRKVREVKISKDIKRYIVELTAA